MSTLFGREHSKRWQFYCGCWWYLSPNRFSISLYLAHSNTFSYIFCIKYINMLSIYLWFENPQVIYIREKGRRTVRAGTEGLHISERGTERAHFHIVGKSFTYIAVCFIFCLLAGCAWGTIVMIKRYNGMRCKIMCATIKKKWVNVCVGERERETKNERKQVWQKTKAPNCVFMFCAPYKQMFIRVYACIRYSIYEMSTTHGCWYPCRCCCCCSNTILDCEYFIGII